jgi:hypothetical protein
MTIFERARSAIAAGIFGAALAACSGANLSGPSAFTPTGSHPELPQTATGQDLLYISEYGGGVVDVFSYPQLQFLGNLSGLEGTPQGECVDKKGDVWIVEAGGHPVIAEYAHGGSTPIASLSAQGEFPYGCSIDRVTGDLAVSSEYSATSFQGSVLIYKKAKGTPTRYVDPQIELLLWCGYDDKGNLFADGLPPSGSREFQLGELPRGSQSFTNIALGRIAFGGNIQWDGKYLTVGDPAYKKGSAIYRVSVSGSSATIVGRTVLAKSYEVYESWIEGDRVIGPDDGPSISTVQVWKYPGGGKPLATLSKGQSSFFNGPFGAAVSPAK